MLKGVVSVPGDKSITHRALLLAALASGTSEIIGPLQSRDCQNTVSCLRALGIEIEEHPRRTIVHGVGADRIQGPRHRAGLRELRYNHALIGRHTRSPTLCQCTDRR